MQHKPDHHVLIGSQPLLLWRECLAAGPPAFDALGNPLRRRRSRRKLRWLAPNANFLGEAGSG